MAMKRPGESALTGDYEKRPKQESGDIIVSYPTAYADLSKIPEEGFLLHPRKFSEQVTGKPSEILVRASYDRLFRQIRYGKAEFVHLSGNPGTGKSCCLWYFLNRLLNDEETKKHHIIVQLVEPKDSMFLIISPNGEVCLSSTPPWQLLITEEGTWMLVDQRYTGFRARCGTTVLFASPNGAVDAVRVMDESRFSTFYLDAWKPSELLKAFNRRYRDDLGTETLSRTGYQRSVHPSGHFRCTAAGYSAAAHFLARMHICGGIARYFFEDLQTVLDRQVAAGTRFIQRSLSIRKIAKEPIFGRDGKPVSTAKGNQCAPLIIPQVTDEVTLSPLYETVTEVLDMMERAVKEEQDLFDEEPEALCEECREAVTPVRYTMHASLGQRAMPHLLLSTCLKEVFNECR